MCSNELHLDVLVPPLQTTEVSSRKTFLQALENFEVTKRNTISINQGLNNNNGAAFEIKEANSFYLTIVRLANECPFADVRESCSKIVEKLKNDGLHLPNVKLEGPSRFIPQNECVSIEVEDPSIQRLYVDAFCVNGRTSHINQLLAYHVEYLDCFLRLESHLMQQNGPLPIEWRYYIGIMGAARHKCEILIEQCEVMFLLCHGDPEWLKGTHKIPAKLQRLNKLNKIIAHQPWLLTVEHLKELLTGDNAMERWAVSELIQAVVILLHFQTLSGFVYGCGVTPEIDLCTSNKLNPIATTNGNEGMDIEKPQRGRSFSRNDTATTAELYEKMRKVESESGGLVDGVKEKLRQFKEVEIKELDEDEFLVVENVNTHVDSLQKYADDANFHYEEFAKRKKDDIDVFRAQDYNWQEHCYSFINRLYPGIGTLLDEKFNCAFFLTYNTMGDMFQNVDTSKFRLATWNYIHLVYGIFHDDYQYLEVNKLLEKSYKMYIKKVACFPERVTFADYWDFYTDMLPSEKVHINLLVLESRLMASLLYVSRLIMQYTASR